MPATFSANDIWDVIIALLTPVVPTYKEYVVQAALPFARIMQQPSQYSHFTRSGSQNTVVLVDGSFVVDIYGEGLEETRLLSLRVRSKLDLFGSPIVYGGGRLLMMEPVGSIFVPELTTGPDSPTAFHSVIQVTYSEQQTISLY